MDINDKIKIDFRRIAISVQRSVEADQLWRTLGSSENHNEYKTQFDIYIPFFESVRDLALCQLITNIARVNDRAKGALSVERLIERIDRSNYGTEQVLEIREKYKFNSEYWEKLKDLRDKCIVHSAAAISEKEIFKEVGITNDQISSSVALAREIMINIGSLINVNNSLLGHTDWTVQEDCNKLLSNLKSGRSAKLRELGQQECT